MSARALGFGWQGGGTGSISGWAVASCEPSRPDTAKTVHKNAFLVLSGNIVISFLGKRVLRFGKSLLSLESRAHLLRLLVGRCEKKRCLRGAEQLVNKSVLLRVNCVPWNSVASKSPVRRPSPPMKRGSRRTVTNAHLLKGWLILNPTWLPGSHPRRG